MRIKVAWASLAIAAGLFAPELTGSLSANAASLFADPNLDAAVSSVLGKAPGTVTTADLQGLTCLSACNLQITNLSGLESATNLIGLYVNGNAIQDLTPLFNDTQLSSLELEQNQITDLGPLIGLTNLSCLSLGVNPVTNYWVISNLTHLTTLSVRGGNLKDLTALRALGSLATLVLWRNYITDPSPLAGLTNLSLLDLRWNALSNSLPVRTWPTNLTRLYLGGNSLSNAPFLPALPNLTFLNLEDNWIRDLTRVAQLTNLNYLVLNRDPATNFFVISNLTRLSSIELRGNSLTNVSFLSSLKSLDYADLAYNRLSDLSTLSGLTNLTSLVLAGNALTNYSSLSGLARLANFWTFDAPVSGALLAANLGSIRYLNAERTGLSNIAPLLALSNLTGLALSQNPVSDLTGLSVLTNLTTLRLERCSLENANFITNFPRLTFLSLAQNRLTDLAALVGLTNLHDVYLKRNRLQNIQPLLALPRLSNVDVSLNFLDLRPGMTALLTVQALQTTPSGGSPCACGMAPNAPGGIQCQKVNLIYLPTNQPPSISSIPKWFIPCSTNSSLQIIVSEYPNPELPLAVTASSANSGLVAVPGDLLPGTNQSRTLTVSAGCDPLSNSTSLALTVIDDVGLSNSIAVQTTVVPNLAFSSVCPNTDSNLLAAIGVQANKPVDNLTLVDLLRLGQLNVAGPSLGDACVWQWLTNLSSLDLAGSSISNLDILTNLSQVTDLAVNFTALTNLSPLATLSNLSSLRIAFGPAVDLTPLSSGFPNLKSLNLTGISLTNLSFLTNLSQLTSLTIDDNRIRDLSPIASLINLHNFSAQQNLVTNLTPAALLTNLSSFDIRLNLIDLDRDTASVGVLTNLQTHADWVQYWPQRSSPTIFTPTQWFIPANTTSTLPIGIVDNANFGAQFVVTARSSNDGLVSNQSLVIAPGTNSTWLLTATPANGQIGNTTISLAATNDAGLATNASFLLIVVVSQPVSIPDLNLQRAILTLLVKPPETLTTVDLLDLTQIDLTGSGVSNLSGLEVATNLTSLVLDNDLVSDLSPLTNLTDLVWLSASNNLITQIPPLSGLAGLAYLNLAANPITNFSGLLSGGLTNLNLSSVSISNLSFLTNLTRLTGLSLDNNRVSDCAPIRAMTNLTALSLSGNLVDNVTFLTNLTQLTYLNLATNRLTDISPLAGLPFLSQVFLQQNMLTNIASLQNLAGFASVSLQQNELDLSSTSPVLFVINALQNAGVAVSYLPQFPLDSDGDGMPNDWEIANGLNPFDPTDALADTDGDGVPNLMEYALGTDPRNPTDASGAIIWGLLFDGGSNYVSLRFRQRNAPLRIRYLPEVSGNNVIWYSDPEHVQQVSVTPLDSIFDSVLVRDRTAFTNGSSRGIRLRLVTN